METTALWILAAAMVLIGMAGLVLPGLPGPPLVFGGLLLAAWAEDFTYVGWPTLLVLGIMALLTYVVDFAATALGAKRFGASKRAVIGAALGALAGLFVGFIGVLIGPFIGAVIGELSARRSLEDATRAGIGATVGLALGAAAKFALAFSMVGIFVVARVL
jgi:uncharacterized protein YqgC (DUF456 family)